MDSTASGLDSATPSAVRPVRSSWNVATSTSNVAPGTSAVIPAGARRSVRRRVMSSRSNAGSPMGCTVSKLKRRLSALDISFTPRSRRFAVAITLKPGAARTTAFRPNSGMAIIFSDRIEISPSWISGGQRVSSSIRTTVPSRIACNTGDGTSARSLGPSAISRA